MKRIARRALSALLSLVLLSGMCLSASAFKYPSAYWKLHDAWAVAVEQQDADQVIELAKKTYDLLMKYEICEDICYNLEPKCARASWCLEMKGDLDGAILWLERQRTFAQWLDTNVRDYSDTLINVDARMEYLKAAASPAIYALTNQPGTAYSASGAPTQGTWYGSTVDGSQSSDYAALMYVTFQDSYSVSYWLNYYQNEYPSFRKAATQGGVIELAWNFSPESTAGAQAVLSADSYIEESLRAMGQLNATVLLRLGAEMNNWSDCDPATYIQAFRKVAQKAKAYDNIKMVFSPDNVSNRNVTFADFYPGDAYVDWIGVSTYHNSNYAGEEPNYTFQADTYGNDAYYGKGLYDSDPLVILAPLARFAKDHGKPMMISECGFSYRSSAGDQTGYAVDQLNKFYSYVNMIYPQIKAVFYFDKTMSGSQYAYALSGSSQVQSAYRTALTNNGAYLDSTKQAGKTWKELSALGDQTGETVKLATYVSFPGQEKASVTYYVDGKAVHTTSQVPYNYDLNTAALTPGKHTVSAVASNGRFREETATYTITVAGRVLPSGLSLDSADLWAQDLLAQADGKDLITARNRSNFRKNVTRLEFAELAVNLIEQATGKAVPLSDQAFTDTQDEVARKAVYAGVTSGRGEGIFAPEASITRQEICVMLNKVIAYADAANGSQTLTNSSRQMDGSRFNDVNQIAGWAVESMAALTNNGLMSGKGDGVAPLANTTTQEAIILILALYNRF